jgi:hypothetical protein
LIGYLVGLVATYAAVWFGFNAHLRAGRAILQALRPVVKMPGREWGVHPVSIVMAGVLVWTGLLWALPMVIAAAAADRVSRRHERKLLRQIGGHVAESMKARRPVRGLPASPDRTYQCPNSICQAAVAVDAAFCPRCGEKLAARLR